MDKSNTFFDCRSDMFIAEETEDFGTGKDFFERIVDEAYKVDFGVFDTVASNDFNEDLHCATCEFWRVGGGPWIDVGYEGEVKDDVDVVFWVTFTVFRWMDIEFSVSLETI
jgi:hypothetical protein